MSTPLRPLDHARGAALLAVGFAMLVLGMPGLDMLGPKRFTEGSVDRREMMKQPWGPIAVGAADVNRAVREPVVKLLTPLQRPFRIAQSWGLYGGGPNKVRRLEILVDGELVFRSNDPERRWLHGPLRYRRIRPVVDAHCQGSSKNSPGLLAFLLRRARSDFPDATSVVIQCTEQRRLGDTSVKVRHRRVASAPGWEIGT